MSAKVISISIPTSLCNELEKYCNKEERSRSYCVKKALEKFLQEQKKSRKK